MSFKRKKMPHDNSVPTVGVEIRERMDGHGLNR